MNKVKKRLIGILLAVIVVAGAVTGILGWKNQILRLPVTNPLLTQATPAGVKDLPILTRPILR